MLDRYQRAAALAPDKLAGLMRNRRVTPEWTGRGDAFWYRRQTGSGEEYVLVDPVAETRAAASTLAELGVHLPTPHARPGVLEAPDGRGLRRRNHDLWLVDGDDETQLMFDGEPGFAWGELSSDNNMVVPFETAGYSAYASAAGRGAIALPRTQLLGITPKKSDGREWALHSSLNFDLAGTNNTGLKSLFDEGKMALVADVPLVDVFGAGSAGFGVMIGLWGAGSILGSLAGRWHLLAAESPDDQIPQHRVDLVFHEDPAGLRGAVLSRRNGSEIAIGEVGFDGVTLRLKMGAAPGQPIGDLPFLVMTPVADRFEGAWDQPGLEGLRLKLVRAREETVASRGA